MLRHTSKEFSYSRDAGWLVQQNHLYWMLDFLTWMHKRLKKEPRFKKVQRWIHRVYLRRATVYVYGPDSDEDPKVFPQGLYCDVTVPEIAFVFDVQKKELYTAAEWEASHAEV